MNAIEQHISDCLAREMRSAAELLARLEVTAELNQESLMKKKSGKKPKC